jgi:hypothetical protein
MTAALPSFSRSSCRALASRISGDALTIHRDGTLDFVHQFARQALVTAAIAGFMTLDRTVFLEKLPTGVRQSRSAGSTLWRGRSGLATGGCCDDERRRP